jgi:hypothetical protein
LTRRRRVAPERQPLRAAEETIFDAPVTLGLTTLTRHRAAAWASVAADDKFCAVACVAASAAVIGVQSAARLARPASTPRGLRMGGFLQLRWTLDGIAFWRDQNPRVRKFTELL